MDILLFEKMLQQAGESSVVSLVHGGTHVDVLIHDVVFDAVTDEPTHADFYAVDKDKKVSVHVPIVFTGEDIAAKSGGVLVKVLHELEVEGLPKYLPHDITVDVSSLTTIGGHISIKDISVPAGVIIKMGLGEAVALLAAPKEEKEEEAAPIDLTAIEVEKKGKKEEEGAEGGEEAAKESTILYPLVFIRIPNVTQILPETMSWFLMGLLYGGEYFGISASFFYQGRSRLMGIDYPPRKMVVVDSERNE